MADRLISVPAARSHIDAVVADPILKACMHNVLDGLPAADAVEVVRCKECIYRYQYHDENGLYHCGGIDTTKDHALPVVAPDFFCAHGERRRNNG